MDVPTVTIPLVRGYFTEDELTTIMVILQRASQRTGYQCCSEYTHETSDPQEAQKGSVKKRRHSPDEPQEYKTARHFVKPEELLPRLQSQEKILCDCGHVVHVGLKKDESGHYVCCGNRNNPGYIPVSELCGFLSVIPMKLLDREYRYKYST